MLTLFVKSVAAQWMEEELYDCYYVILKSQLWIANLLRVAPNIYMYIVLPRTTNVRDYGCSTTDVDVMI